MSTTSRGTALITGASAGIGSVYSDHLSKLGYGLIRVARDKSGRAALLQLLADAADWDKYEAGRRAMFGKLSSAIPARRCNVKANGSTGKVTANIEAVIP